MIGRNLSQEIPLVDRIQSARQVGASDSGVKPPRNFSANFSRQFLKEAHLLAITWLVTSRGKELDGRIISAMNESVGARNGEVGEASFRDFPRQ